jgi:hypothetical protein
MARQAHHERVTFPSARPELVEGNEDYFILDLKLQVLQNNSLQSLALLA